MLILSPENPDGVTAKSLIETSKMICRSIAMTIGLMIHMAKIKCHLVKNELVFWFQLFYHNNKQERQEHRSVFSVNLQTLKVQCQSKVCITLPADVIKLLQNFAYWCSQHLQSRFVKSWSRGFEYQN